MITFDTNYLKILFLSIFIFTGANYNGAFAQVEIFKDGFEDGVFNPEYWTARPSLAGASGGRVEVVNSTANAHTGTSSAFIGRTSDGASTTNALDLSLDLSAYSQVELRFWLRDYFGRAATR